MAISRTRAKAVGLQSAPFRGSKDNQGACWRCFNPCRRGSRAARTRQGGAGHGPLARSSARLRADGSAATAGGAIIESTPNGLPPALFRPSPMATVRAAFGGTPVKLPAWHLMDRRITDKLQNKISEWERMRDDFGDRSPLAVQEFIDGEIEKLRWQKAQKSRPLLEGRRATDRRSFTSSSLLPPHEHKRQSSTLPAVTSDLHGEQTCPQPPSQPMTGLPSAKQ